MIKRTQFESIKAHQFIFPLPGLLVLYRNFKTNVDSRKKCYTKLVIEQKGFSPIIILIIVTILAVSGYLLYKQFNQPASQSQQTLQYSPAPTSSLSPTSSPIATPTTAKTTSLNPNTGNLYTDIKVRLNAVLK